jgi:hypothetical protein
MSKTEQEKRRGSRGEAEGDDTDNKPAAGDSETAVEANVTTGPDRVVLEATGENHEDVEVKMRRPEMKRDENSF